MKIKHLKVICPKCDSDDVSIKDRSIRTCYVGQALWYICHECGKSFQAVNTMMEKDDEKTYIS
jgi:transposase-like protein